MGVGLTLFVEPDVPELLRCNIWHFQGNYVTTMERLRVLVVSVVHWPSMSPPRFFELVEKYLREWS